MNTRKENIVDNFHGTLVPDPYRWLEDAESEEVRAWSESQNQRTEEFIRENPRYDQIKKRITQLWNYPKYFVTQKVGDRYFYQQNNGLENQAILYKQDGEGSESEVLLDPNTLSEDGTVALSNYSFSKDGKWMAYTTSSSGSDRQEIHIRNVDTGEDGEEKILWCKFTNMQWNKEGTGFYYTRFPIPGSVPKEDESNYSQVFFHKLGTPQSEDNLIFEDPENKEFGHHPIVTNDGEYLLIYVTYGTSPKNRIYYRKIDSKGPFVKLLDEGDASYVPVGNDGSIFYFHTDYQAPRGRIISIDVNTPERDLWKELVPEQNDVISQAIIVNEQFVIAYLHDAHHQLKLFNLDGSFDRDIELPILGSLTGLSGKRQHNELFLGLTSYLNPASIYRYDFNTHQLELMKQAQLDFDSSAYETKQVFFTSKDGTRVPMFLTHKKGLTLDGDNPTLLYGYGGFNISVTPAFSPARLVWLENGGVFAVANLRGGSEYGEDWHQAGMLEKKQNVFDDFISAAEWLIDQGYTRPQKLGIYGRSNGGLLVGACMTQRPDLYGAAIVGVPVIDMLRYHKFTVGRYWIPEYGNAEKNPEHFEFMYKYSPLHNVREGVEYPPTLVATAETDDRVVPAHAFKFAATLQEKYHGEHPILLRVEKKAGHGHGKPTSKQIEEEADFQAFLFKTLQVEV